MCRKGSPFLELSSNQMSELKYQAQIVGTHSGDHSQTSVLIDQRCRLLIIISKCVSTHSVCGCRPTLPSALAYTRTHTLSQSLSLRVSVFFPFHIKTHLPQLSSFIEIQDSIVFGCSHFIGSTNTKYDHSLSKR
jgi:hypothetical protein